MLSKQIINKPKDDNHKPLFVQFILQNIYTVYETIMNNDDAKLQEMCKKMDITLNKAVMNKNDRSAVAKDFMS